MSWTCIVASAASTHQQQQVSFSVQPHAWDEFQQRSSGPERCPLLQVVMAENNGRVFYSHGAGSWDRNYGVRILRSSLGADGALTTDKVGACLEHLLLELQGWEMVHVEA